MKTKTYDLIILGAGAAGLIAAQEAARAGLRTLVLEGQAAAGAKVLLAGGGRCNATNAVVTEHDFGSDSNCSRLIRHVLEHLHPENAVAFFEQWGAELAVETDGQYFTKSGRAADVVAALLKAVDAAGAKIEYERRVREIVFKDGVFQLSGEGFERGARAFLVATGGLSYPGTGSDGSGLAIARQFGHTVIPAIPALTPLLTEDPAWIGLQGIVVDCRLTLWIEGKKFLETDGPLLFAHFGFSGPAVLDMSRYWKRASDAGPVRLTADFMPFLKDQELEQRLSLTKKAVRSVLGEILASRLVSVLTEKAGIDGGRMFASLNAEQRRALKDACRMCELPVSGVMGWSKAEATAGGVDLKELKGASLESKLQPGLFFAGEVLDVDGRVGGFNLHWAWASGVAAARGVIKASQEEKK